MSNHHEHTNLIWQIADLRDFENISLKEDIDKYFRREVLPHVPDAWTDCSKNKVRL